MTKKKGKNNAIFPSHANNQLIKICMKAACT